jgi:hypothetical protein
VRVASRGIAVAATGLTLAVLAAIPGAAKQIDGYCSPTGDYCTSAVDRSGETFLGISTFSFAGKYSLCTRTDDGADPQCKRFRLRKNDDVYRSFVKFSNHFDAEGSGTYCATWHKFGNRLGPRICFAFNGD